ncbi:serine/threonine protein kinase with PASTA sensor(s) [Thermincola ferriacetica]|uniref:non-specific serine/threonine protein kinase n=2 Tax=Thermincola ferriacetica TaxID=281456 RepID=A0A0L6VZI8_9FIRM|nr:serine/threonine protein kinase with PASTA sensor(s) [Thermincola ferriacetica]
MALVYKARCTLLQRIVTIKVLRPEFTSDPDFVDRFRNEAQAVARLSHPNIVGIYDVGEENGIHYIVMEYIEGRNLKEVIHEKGALPVNEAVNIAKQICDALSHAHENGIIHRDIKPHNILLANNGRVKVTDFGIARAVTASTITQHGTILGSVHYISPEQAKGQPATAQSDLYSAGVVLYEMLTGKVPFEADTPVSVALKHIQEKPAIPSTVNPQVTPELDKVILRAMEKDPGLRYQTAKSMAADLNTVLLGRISDETKAIDMDEFATKVMPVVSDTGQEGGTGESRKERRRKRVRPMVKVYAAVIILGILIGLAYGLNAFMYVPEVEVPDVTNMPLDTALRTLEAIGLKAEFTRQNHPEVEAGNVISQEPGPGEKIKKNRTVMLYVSSGPKMVEVPDVGQKDIEAAKIDLENKGFKYNIKESYSDEVVEGAVISQLPEAGEKAPEGSTVTLEVSKGREPRYVIVPNLIGLTLSEAKKKIEAANLILSQDIGQEESTEYEAGIVIRQDPVSGERQVLEGTEVKVVLSRGPGPEAKTARVEMKVPNDGSTHNVKIVVTDVTGTREAYNKTLNPGEQVSEIITYYKEARIEVWMDGTLLEEKTVK